MNLSDFGLQGGRRKSLLVVGAGASRGASFVKDQTTVLPPLDLDFFQQVTRMDQTGESRRLLEFVRVEYGHEVGLSMEQFFSEADYTDRFHKDLNVGPGPHVRRYRRALEDFMKVLPRLLETTTASSCTYHKLLASLLQAKDAVLTFNYDCLMDRALRDAAGNRWDPGKEGYAFQVASGIDGWKKHTQGRPVNTSIRLLKMHGSCNWRRQDAQKVGLATNTSDVTELTGTIIPPTWFKDLQTFPFNEIWKAARVEIRTSRILVVVGYSVPQTDLFSKSLFKVEAGSKAKGQRLDLLVLVNPSAEARRRFLEVVREGLAPSTRILEYRTLEELGTVLRRNSDGTPSNE